MIRVKDREAVIYTDTDVAMQAVNNAINMLLVEGRIDQIGPLYHELATLEGMGES